MTTLPPVLFFNYIWKPYVRPVFRFFNNIIYFIKETIILCFGYIFTLLSKIGVDLAMYIILIFSLLLFLAGMELGLCLLWEIISKLILF